MFAKVNQSAQFAPCVIEDGKIKGYIKTEKGGRITFDNEMDCQRFCNRTKCGYVRVFTILNERQDGRKQRKANRISSRVRDTKD